MSYQAINFGNKFTLFSEHRQPKVVEHRENRIGLKVWRQSKDRS